MHLPFTSESKGKCTAKGSEMGIYKTIKFKFISFTVNYNIFHICMNRFILTKANHINYKLKLWQYNKCLYDKLTFSSLN